MSYENLAAEKKAMLEQSLQEELRKNRYDENSSSLTLSEARSRAFLSNSSHYKGLFMDGADQADLQEACSIPPHSIKEDSRIDKMNAFFFWASWSTVTGQRSGFVLTNMLSESSQKGYTLPETVYVPSLKR